MQRKLKILLWVTIGLTIAAYPTTLLVTWVPFMPLFAFVMTFFALIFVCGVLIVYWTQKTIKQVPLKRYLLTAGASAMGILFFQGPVHMLTEFGFIMALFVCPVALIVGTALALRYKSTPES
jgi:peptidoglycan/LPS O-acetylase OafA/YrhL